MPVAGVIQPGAVQGGQTAQCTITVNEVVTEDTQIAMQTDRPEVYAGFPATVIVASGNNSVTFSLQTVPVSGSVQTIATGLSQVGVSLTPR